MTPGKVPIALPTSHDYNFLNSSNISKILHISTVHLGKLLLVKVQIATKFQSANIFYRLVRVVKACILAYLSHGLLLY